MTQQQLKQQVDTLRSQVSQLEVSAAAAEAEYSRQLARNREELAVLKATRSRELTAMMVRVRRVAVWQGGANAGGGGSQGVLPVSHVCCCCCCCQK